MQSDQPFSGWSLCIYVDLTIPPHKIIYSSTTALLFPPAASGYSQGAAQSRQTSPALQTNIRPQYSPGSGICHMPAVAFFGEPGLPSHPS